jgi:cytochrome P450
VVGGKARHVKTIPQGTFVFAATLGAMFDGDALNAPDNFRTDCPPADDLHFGLGVHRGFGERFNDVVLP